MIKDKPKRPNILLITTDQQRYDTIQLLGNKAIFTPHLNYLVSQGVSFTRCYTDSPMCIPARQTIMTGRYAATNRQALGDSVQPISMCDLPTLPGVLTQTGYQTRAIGKMHFHPMRAHYGFEHMELLEDYYRNMERHGGPTRPMDHGVGQNEMTPVFSTVEESQSLTRWTVQRSVDFLETRDTTRPFFLWCSFAKPHPPLDCDLKYWHMYENIELPSPVYGDWSQTPDALPAGIAAASWSVSQIDRLSPQQLQAVRRAYYACITQIDYNLGHLLSRMREMKLLEDTWIIFTSDHGEMLGDHWLGAKFVPLEASAHVPMIVRPPVPTGEGHPWQGMHCDRLVCLADLLPTCLHIAEVDGFDKGSIDGFSLLDVVEKQDGHERVFFSFYEMFGLIEGRYKYIYTARDNHELLFDIQADPHEQQDLIRSGKAIEVHKNMQASMIRWLEEHVPDAVKEGRLVGIGEMPTHQDESGRRASPGLHTQREASDVLH